MKKLDPLVEMHLLLREHGWEPELQPTNGECGAWWWSRPDTECFFETWEDPEDGDFWIFETGNGPKVRGGIGRSVAGLRRRLKQLARASTA